MTTKALPYILALVILAPISIILYRRISKGQELNRLKGELDSKREKPSGSLTPLDYGDLANKLEAAMQGWGTNEEAIKDVLFNLRTSRDAYELDKTFGIRKGESLGSWFKSDGETESVRKILDQLNISYSFPIVD